MDRDTAVAMGQDAIRARNRRLIDGVLAARAASGRRAVADPRPPVDQLPLVAVTCATGWECYAIVEELTKTRRFRVRALYRTPRTQAAARLEALLARTEATDPGLLTLHPGVDLNSPSTLAEAFRDCVGVVLYVTANTSVAGKITNYGRKPFAGRAVVMRQVTSALEALRSKPSVTDVVTLVFPTDKVTGIADDPPEVPWWIDQRLRLSDLLRGQGVNITCIHRPAYYYAMHRVDYTNQTQVRGDTALSKTTIREGHLPGINEPDFTVNWVDVRDVGKWVGTVFDHPEVFRNEDLSIASCAMTGSEAVEIAERTNRHGTKFEYRQFPQPVMKMISVFNEEVVYPLRYSQWYRAAGNGYDFASNADLADLDRIHPRWTFECKLEDWGITEIRPNRQP